MVYSNDHGQAILDMSVIQIGHVSGMLLEMEM